MYSSSKFLQFPPARQPLTTITTASPFMLRRSSHGFGVFHRKRARFKRQSWSLIVVNSSFLPPPFDGSVPIDSLALSVAGFSSGLAVFMSSKLFGKSSGISSDRRTSTEEIVGEWILFTSPTPFNRFVLLRCSLLSFYLSGGEGDLPQSLSDRLVQEERYFVTLDSGKIVSAERAAEEKPLEYQRVCISTEDGGVVSLDWPADLDLREERGLDTTVILIPGTPEGSMDEGVRSFVSEALRRGVFPVVMNPRGCAGSPLTTPRLFTAGDSDDISTAMRFLSKTRPWTTLMGVGRGYGANMLTKYLAEAGETSPLTAAVCIDNPFDLEEITRTSPFCVSLDRQLTGGLVEILVANKELFQGRPKAFDVEKALSSKSVREFDKAVSMVTNGFERVEDFYSSCATRDVIGELKVPVLFIQNDGVVPHYSVPRSSIAENLFTSLLLCSSSPSLIDGCTVAVSWCQDLAMEWLTAVELGLLKGRHPFLKDVDVTVNPSKGLVLSEAIAPEKGITAKKLPQVARGEVVNGYHVDPSGETLEDSDITTNSSLPSGTELEKNVKVETGSDEPENGGVSTNGPVEVEDEEPSVEESERGQMLQTTEVVVKMLDVTMPGTLKAEEKKKVMDAVGRGETVLKALQDAVPEDVRGKLTTAVTEIMQSPANKLNFQNLKLPSFSPGMKKAEEAKKEPSSTAGQKDSHSPDPINKNDSLASSSVDSDQDDSSVLAKKGNDEPGFSPGNESSANEKTSAADGSGKASEAKVDSTNQGQPIGTGDVTSDDDKVDQGSVIAKRQRQEETNKKDEKGTPMANENSSAADGSEKASDAKVDSTNQGQPIGADDVTSVEDKVDQGAVTQQQRKEETNGNDENAKQSATDQNKGASTGNEGDAGQSSASQPVEKEEIDDQKKETEVMQPVSDETKPAVQEPIQAKDNVSQAFEALTGMDDSTQVAVNSVFGVLENMITQLDEEGNEVSNEENDTDERKVTDEENVTDKNIRSPSEEKTPYKKEAESQMSSEHSHDTACSVHETGKGSDNDKTTRVMNEKHLGGEESVIGKQLPKILPARSTDSLENSSSDDYLGEELSEEQIAKQLDLDTTTALMLDYYPEDGKWKVLDQQPEYLNNVAGNAAASRDTHGNVQVHSPGVSNEQNIIEPSYVILDHEQVGELSELHDAVDDQNEDLEKSDEECSELEHLIKVIVSDSLNVEVQRRVSSAGMRQFESQLSRDINRVASTLSFAVVYEEPTWTFKRNSKNSDIPAGKVGKLRGDAIIKAISSAIQDAHFLRKVLPVGVVVGSVLAALRKYFVVSTTNNAKRDNVMGREQKHRNNDATTSVVPTKMKQKSKQKNSSIGEMVESGLQNISNEPVMVGAMTAALGASAMLVQHEDPQSGGIMSKPSGKESKQKDQSGMVASFAEKAMSIAGPAVPTKETGEVDQERIVTMLADLGQRGGILRLVGKLALLWGGLRGAMSLTDRLIQFLHIDEWPLLKRAVGFVGMVLVLWSPVVIPLLPTLLQSWSTSTPSRVAELATVVGLYVAVFILVMLWGKRVRKYENPFREYGLDFKASPKKQILEFLKALAGGIIVVLLIQSINTIIGAAILSRPPYLPHPFDAMKWLKGGVQLLLLIVRGFATATFIVFVEELLFRSWMPNEIAIDMGYHQSIIITGLVFALFQRSLRSIPGLWLLSLALAGARERSQGNLIVPIGLRTGMIAASFVLHTGGFLTYNPSSPVWIAGKRPLQPFSGVVGLGVAFALALVLYPRPSPETKIQKYN
uniref:Embryogenesis-associated protein EMB8 n=1 Tax=Noccaea caerulescens TaxID=107243 RepID=A0A1J3I0Z5_NOCCA